MTNPHSPNLSCIASRPDTVLNSQILCAICACPVLLEQAKTDERGQAVHENCYVLKLLATYDDARLLIGRSDAFETNISQGPQVKDGATQARVTL